jgi:hypothetical protein
MTATAQATDVTVTNLTDGPGAGPSGSLRKAITDTEGTIGADRVLFQAGLTGTITLSSGDLPQLFDSVEILGAGANVTIAGNGSDRLFVMSGANTVKLSELTMTGGSAGGGDGGAIVSAGTNLTIEDSTISNSSAADGGGLALSGPTTITDSTVSGNHATAGDGGGIQFVGSYPLVIQGSTLSANTATSEGAGLYVKDASATITRSTISGNTGAAYGGGVWSDGGGLNIDDSTIAGNSAGTGGGVTSADHPTDPSLTNTIVADNTATYGPDLNSAGAPDEPFNVSFGMIENTADAVINETVAGSNITGQDPQLGPLQDNGGATLTRAPAPASPVIDKGSSVTSFDQRGRPRAFDFPAIANSTAVGANAADIGAVEQAAPQDITVTTSTDSAVDPGTTLREAIEQSENENLTGSDRILFAPGVTGTIALSGQQLPQIHEPLQIVGPGATSLSVSGSDASRILSLQTNPGDDVKLSGLTLTHANPGNAVEGGAILAQGADLTVQDSTISDSAAQDGGAIFFSGAAGSLALRDSTISGNDALPGGNIAGGVFGYDVPMAIEGSTFSGNTAPNRGGGLFFGGYDGLTVKNSTFSGNSAPSGAGIYLGYAFPTAIRSSTIADNTGSGIQIYQATPAVTNSIVAGNTGGDLASSFFDQFNVSFSLVENPGGGTVTSVPGSNIFGVDPELGPLAGNGGPTQTLRPLIGSPVIDQGKAGAETTDQRGSARPLNVPSLADSGATGHDGADMGAVELTQTEAVPAVVTPPPSVVPTPPAAKSKKCKKAKKRAAAAKKKCKKKK